MMLDQSSFLDKKLLSTLTNSSRVQSQLKLSMQTNKSNLLLSRRSQASQEEHRVVQDHVQMCMKLFDEPKIMNNLKSFLTLDVYQVLHSSYKARKKASKTPKTPPSSSKLRIFQDDLLYRSSKLDDEEVAGDMVDIQDIEQLKLEIAELRQQHNKLVHDNQLGTYFLHDENCTLALRYQYLSSKLQFARFCAHTNKSQGMAGDYLSKLLDLRSMLLIKTNKHIESSENSIKQANAVKRALHKELLDLMQSLHKIDVDQRSGRDLSQDMLSTFSTSTDHVVKQNYKSYTPEEKMQLFDARLLKINQILKPPEAIVAAANTKISPSKKSRDRHAAVPVSEEVKEMLETDMKPLREGAVRAASSNLKQFSKEVESRMEACYQMTVRSLKKRDANRQMIYNGVRVNNQEPNHFKDHLEDYIAHIEKREEMLASAVDHRDAARGRIIEKHLEELKRPEALVTQKRVQFLNKLKAEYNSLYPEAQSKTSKRRASFASPSHNT